MSDTARVKSVGDQLSADEVNKDLPATMTAGTPFGATPCAVYLADSDGRVYPTLAMTDDEKIDNFVGFIFENVGGGGSPIAVQTHGVVAGFTGLDAGKEYYLDDSAEGTLSATPATYQAAVGIAISSTELFMYSRIRRDFQGYSDEVANRTLDSEYQNTSGRWKLIIATITTASGTGAASYAQVQAYIGTGSPATSVGYMHQTSEAAGGAVSSTGQLTFLVPINYYYKIADEDSGGTSTKRTWLEINLNAP